MSLITHTNTPQYWPLAYLISLLASVRRKPVNNSDGKEKSQRRRDFVLEMMQSRPEAIQSEVAWQCMMYLYPSRF